MTTLQDIKMYTEMIPTYDGDIKTLSNFIKTIDETYLILDELNLSTVQKLYSFNLIKNKLINDAKRIISQNQFRNWEDLKIYMTTNFNDRTTTETLMLELLETKFKQSSETTLQEMLQKFEQYKSKIALKNYNQDQKNCLIQENQKLVVY